MKASENYLSQIEEARMGMPIKFSTENAKYYASLKSLEDRIELMENLHLLTDEERDQLNKLQSEYNQLKKELGL